MISKTTVWQFAGIFSLILFPLPSTTLDNGLARTPPMGWLAWERFRCNIDCENDPDNCISEQLFMTMADLLVSEGYKDLGYDIISLDDCWMSSTRDENGRLQANATRFPNGIAALGEYFHSKGLRFGMYEDFGTATCEGYPGIIDNMELDANSFAEWGVDYVKLDGCNSEPEDMDEGYTKFGAFLNATGRPMVYSCSWPVYQYFSKIEPNYTLIMETCNLWRNYVDIMDSWASVEEIIKFYGENQDDMIPHAGPGHWNDPDMIIVGNFGLSLEQSKTQMALWAIWASPLLLSVDLRTIRPEFKAIIQNKRIIAVNQDKLGIQGRRIQKRKRGIEIWRRPISPELDDNFSYAVVVTNRDKNAGMVEKVTFSLGDIGLWRENGYLVEDLYTDANHGILISEDKLTVDVPPSGCVMLQFTLAEFSEKQLK